MGTATWCQSVRDVHRFALRKVLVPTSSSALFTFEYTAIFQFQGFPSLLLLLMATAKHLVPTWLGRTVLGIALSSLGRLGSVFRTYNDIS